MRFNFLAVFLVVIIVLAGCTQNANQTNNSGETNSNNTTNLNSLPASGGNDMAETVQNGDSIQVNYRGTLSDGTEFDSSLREGKSPLEFEVGAGRMIKGFDAAVVGMKLNEEKTVVLAPADAYGEERSNLILQIQKEQFGDQFDQLTVGSRVTADNGFSGTVTAKTATKATINFNHELAGKTLTFWIKIVSITKKTA